VMIILLNLQERTCGSVSSSGTTCTKCETVQGNYFNGADIAVLGCDTVWTCRLIPTFWRNILSPSSALNMETVSLKHGNYLQIHMASQPRTTTWTSSLLWEPHILNLTYVNGRVKWWEENSSIS
jgi:hypothetical protein